MCRRLAVCGLSTVLFEILSEIGLSDYITEQPSAVIISASFGPEAQNYVCSICLNKVITTVQYVNGACTWLACTGIFFIGGVLGCCLIPFFVNTCKDAKHICPVCNTELGIYKRL
ncbi:lipopolysaccharide-induced tumor necrosis factor-alpha factor homolog [Clonorchis sinensis]|uniref:Lipopolysaccharide-induced tumor necrosis factor-alpha factor homolog n=1 Tax=Clonorchis sinensis TaxID=79923 RepID=G7Y5N9_CLOSI|nr:lipopolysaccharide-induced tumor necrosis factor-alpha factor homolog [Clonorchis sinensis]